MENTVRITPAPSRSLLAAAGFALAVLATALVGGAAAAGWLVWRASGIQGAGAFLTVYAVQLALNAAWTPLFFGAGLYGAALIDIVLLAVAVAVTIVLAWRHSRTAALLLAPYLAWVAFAGALNAAIWAAN